MKNLDLSSNRLTRDQMRSVMGAQKSFDFAECSATCLDSQGYAYTITCSGGHSCTSSDFNGCSSGDDVKTCPHH